MENQLRKNILLIDDHEATRLLMKTILQKTGYNVSTAESIAAAKKHIEREIPHLVLVDLILSGESGFSYIIYHKQSQYLADVPLIVISGIADKESIVQAIGLGITDYMIKPLPSFLLIRKIKKALKESEFPVVKFPDDSGPKASVSFRGNVAIVSELDLSFEVPVRIQENTPIRCNGGFFEEVSPKGEVVFQRTRSLPRKTIRTGYYLNEVSMIGISEFGLKKIRKIMKESQDE